MSARWLRPYRAILSARFRMLLQYRAAALAGLWTQIFFGLVLLMIYEAFYRSTTVRQPMTFAEIVSYVWLGQALLAMLPWNADAEIRAMVRSGAVAYELCRPIDLYSLWYARALAWRTAPTILRAVPMCVIAAVILPLVGLRRVAARESTLARRRSRVRRHARLYAPPRLRSHDADQHQLSSGPSAGTGPSILLTALATFLSGMIVPLPLFPDWAQPIVQALPFAGLVDLPFRVFTGHIPAGADAVSVLQHQIVWTIALVLFGRWLLSRGMRRVVVQGG